MNNNTRRFVAIVGIGLALMMPMNKVLADSENKEFEDSESFKKLSAEWWQWALSIPISDNPMLDTTWVSGLVGQRGSVWFLAGFFDITGGPGGTVTTRQCSVPEGKSLFFPVINQINFNTPGVCGQKPGENLSVKVMRAFSADYIDKAANLSVTVDGIAIKKQRIQSEVFEIGLPKDNVFTPFICPELGAGIYSPAVDDGFYVLLNPLSVGSHALHFHAERPAGTIVQDVTYHLTVVPVLLK
jgi:hypothetical protein